MGISDIVEHREKRLSRKGVSDIVEHGENRLKILIFYQYINIQGSKWETHKCAEN